MQKKKEIISKDLYRIASGIFKQLKCHGSFNTESLREKFRKRLSGKFPWMDIKCDESVNTPSVVDYNEFAIKCSWIEYGSCPPKIVTCNIIFKL